MLPSSTPCCRLLALAFLVFCVAGHAATSGEAALRARYDQVKAQLADSPFQRPLLLFANGNATEPRGEVFAVVAQPFERTAQALRSAGHWCDMLILSFNVKRCVPTGKAGRERLELAVSHKSSQPDEQAQQVMFEYQAQDSAGRYLSVQLQAEQGPLGTHNYRLSLEVLPLGPDRSLLHLSYAYGSGFVARLATEAYLATAGRHKVGFSVAGRDVEGQVRLVDGVQGMAERNTMRYFLAIEAFLDTQSLPEDERREQRLRAWFAATERYPRQLHEMSLEDYLDMKRREIQPQGPG